MDQYQQFIHISRYARWLPELKRRETWEETITRLISFYHKKWEKLTGNRDDALFKELHDAIYSLNVMPSMRSMMTAGEAAERENIAMYNCAYVSVSNKRAFSETLYILMCGTGVGFSCERQEVNQLPLVPEDIVKCDDVIVVGDSKEGWAKAYKKLIAALYNGEIPTIDYSRVRAAGKPLKVFGGRASGPEPLKRLFDFTTNKMKGAQGRKLTSLEVHDIMCMIGEITVVGGVRRAALISLSNLSDTRMADAKSGQWWLETPWRSLANNSAVYTEKPDAKTFLAEWLSLVRSGSGERGIINRQALQKQASKWGKRDKSLNYGVNP